MPISFPARADMTDPMDVLVLVLEQRLRAGVNWDNASDTPKLMRQAAAPPAAPAEPMVDVRVPCPNKVNGVCPLPNVHCAYPDCTNGKVPRSYVTPAAPADAQHITGGQGHVAAARCPHEGIVTSEATCLTAGQCDGNPANTAGIVSDRRGFDSRTPDQPVAWVFPMRCGFGVQFQRPADYTDEDGNLVQPQPLYSADALAALRAERDALRLMVKDDAQWAQENERLTRDRDEWKRKYGDANVWGLQNCAAWKDRAERTEAALAQARAVIAAADRMRNGEDCPMCDSGKLRNPAKFHWDTCAFAAYDAARRGENGEYNDCNR